MNTPPLVVAYGMGVDSTAMLVGMHVRGIRPDKILFADTGSEKPETYDYLPTIQAWLAAVGFPAVEIVRYAPKHGKYTTLEGNCLVNGTMPSIAFGRKGCSQKFKREPQDRHVAAWQPAKDAWAAGLKVTKAIGYDNGKADGRRSVNLTDDAEYHYWYPLREWGWDREECKRQIAAAGLSVPMKSACFFCTASHPAEIDWLVDTHPELADRILAIEAAAQPKQQARRDAGKTAIVGLWRKECKGTRGGAKHPAAMTPYIQARRVRLPMMPQLAAEPCSENCF
jgi:hypothetical protein